MADDSDHVRPDISGEVHIDADDGVDSSDSDVERSGLRRGTADDRQSPSAEATGQSSSGAKIDTTKQVVELLRENHALRAENQELRNEIMKLKKRIKDLMEGKRKKKMFRTWPDKLRELKHPETLQPGDCNKLTYENIYKLSCWEENCSPCTTHPCLKLGEAPSSTRGAVSRSVNNQRMLLARKERLRELVLLPNIPRLFLEWYPRDCTHTGFQDLPAATKVRIFEYLLNFNGKLVHAISRLDPNVEPDNIPPVQGLRSGLLNRFYLTGKKYPSECSLTYSTIAPNEMLAPLLVSREALHIGVEVFFSKNRFTFSSLGEFGRFCKGIGEARRHRLQRIELVWKGSQNLTQDTHSRRTIPLMCFGDMPRLQHLTLHIEESSLPYIRRSHESIIKMRNSWVLTAGQPNHRMTRSLRTIQGIDYIYQLRGLKTLKVYDLAKGSGRHPVRDWTAVRDLERVCKREKTEVRQQEAQLERLASPLPNFKISEDLKNAVRHLFDQSYSYDPKLGFHEDNDTSLDSDHSDRSSSASSSSSVPGWDGGRTILSSRSISHAPRDNGLRRQRRGEARAFHPKARGNCDRPIEIDSDSDDDQNDDDIVFMGSSGPHGAFSSGDSDLEVLGVCKSRPQIIHLEDEDDTSQGEDDMIRDEVDMSHDEGETVHDEDDMIHDEDTLFVPSQGKTRDTDSPMQDPEDLNKEMMKQFEQPIAAEPRPPRLSPGDFRQDSPAGSDLRRSTSIDLNNIEDFSAHLGEQSSTVALSSSRPPHGHSCTLSQTRFPTTPVNDPSPRNPGSSKRGGSDEGLSESESKRPRIGV